MNEVNTAQLNKSLKSCAEASQHLSASQVNLKVVNVNPHQQLPVKHQNSGSQVQDHLLSSKTRVSAFKMPTASGSGEFLPALEKDMTGPNPTSFRNLTRLFQEKQKAKFYQKNFTQAQKILSQLHLTSTQPKHFAPGLLSSEDNQINLRVNNRSQDSNNNNLEASQTSSYRF